MVPQDGWSTPGAREECRVVGGEYWGVVLQDSRNGRVLPELTVQEPAYHLAVPSVGMLEACIERQVAFVERRPLMHTRLAPAHRHVEHREVQEGDRVRVPDDESKRLSRFGLSFLGRAE